jgi:hypothetical protein
MSDIELVIKIPESTYKVFKKLSKIIGVLVYEKDILTLIKAVKNGKPLPKGHGRIGDLDALRCENTDFDTYNDYCTMFDEIEAAETIIEADKAESEE